MIFDVKLSPNNVDMRKHTLTLPYQDWESVLRVVAKQGCGLNFYAGLDRQSCKVFARALQGLAGAQEPSAEHRIYRDLAAFLTGPGAGGFVLGRSPPSSY